ncbi:hypothetical protein [Brevibacillus fortis]|uniref:Uncharacterized protein n=1 Tax=Brevibacillus fortis TaxID=2126352 RepID=A0A2P7V6C9_9BACL|nr:hypothetical protein [Brevibacillus fortis]PSJ94774.1 hypothetical protein C7R93_15445 [Brevibacillus fortis]
MRKFYSSVLAVILLFSATNISYAAEKNNNEKVKTNMKISKEATEEERELAEQIKKLKDKSKNREEYIKGLEELGTTPEKTIVFRYNQVTDENGKKSLELIDKEEHEGNFDPSNAESDEMTTLGGEKTDLTMWVDVLPGEDEIRGLQWITLDYYFEWSDTEWVNGSEDGWAVNWDTTEAYATATGADGDMTIEEEAIGGMGITTDDDNEQGNAYVILKPRKGYDQHSADGEITFEYAHTWGYDAPPITFSVAKGVVSIGSEIDLEESAWTKSGRDNY